MEKTLFDKIIKLYRMTRDGKDGHPLANKLWAVRHPGKPVDSHDNEYRSWVNSLPRLISDIHFAGLDNLDLIMEYGTTDGVGRIDAILVGKNHHDQDQILLVENKQWTDEGVRQSNNPAYVNVKVGPSEWDQRYHPLTQLRAYYSSLTQNHSYLRNGKTKILIAAYVHNLSNIGFLSSGIYQSNKKRNFKGIPYNKFIFGLKSHEDGKYGHFAQFLKYYFKDISNRNLTRHILRGVFTYNDVSLERMDQIKPNEEQYQVAASLMTDLKQLIQNPNKEHKIVIIRGNAGTGKTIIGFYLIHLYRKIYKDVHGISAPGSDAVYSTAKSFEIHSFINYKHPYEHLVSYADTLKSTSNLLIVDESQRISDINNLSMYLNKTHLLVLLEDDKQVITPADNGSFEAFKNYINSHDIDHEYIHPLRTEMRNNGGIHYTDSVLNLLYGCNYDVTKLPKNDYQVLDFGDNLSSIKEQMNQWQKDNNLVRWVAPFCWKWPYPHDGKRIDIRFSDRYGNKFKHPWNPQGKFLQGKWLNSKDKQYMRPVGCVYTTQGLECDYTGLIWWDDLVWRIDPTSKKGYWKINIDKIKDSSYKYSINHPSSRNLDKIKRCIINTYYILLTRAVKGIAIWFKDSTTEGHVRKVLNINKKERKL